MAYFFALAPEGLKDNDEIKRLLAKFKRTLNDREKNVRWVRPEMWHITLHYLGPLDIQQKSLLLDAFQNWSIPEGWSDITLRIQNVGAFPESERARVLWLGVQRSQALLDMQTQLGELLKAHSFEPEEREYHPHLSVARFRNPISANSLIQLGGRKFFGDYKLGEIVLFESVIENHMAKYLPVAARVLSSHAVP